MSTPLLLCAAGLSLAWFLLHFLAGGRLVARPLRDHPGLDHTVMATMWMCWHMVTALLLLMALFFLAAVIWDNRGLAIAGTACAAAFTLAGIAAAPVLGTRYKVIPQGWLFVPVAALGLLAL